MSFAMIFRSIIEILLVGFTIWGLFHEELFADFEHKLFCAVRRRRLKPIKSNKANKRKCA